MKIKDICESSTSSGSIAPVSAPLGGTQKRVNVGKGVYSKQKVGSLMTGKQTSKKFANSVSEGKKPEHTPTVKSISSKHGYKMAYSEPGNGVHNFTHPKGHELWYANKGTKKGKWEHTTPRGKQTYGTGAKALQNHLHTLHGTKVSEDEIRENDLIVGPDKKKSVRKSGLINPNENPAGRDIDVLNHVLANGESILGILQQMPAGQGIPEWAKSAIAKANSLLGNVNASLIEKHVPAEGKKVDRMVKHIEKSEKDLGKSKTTAKNIAWATANKRGMLDNKNKK